MFNPGICYKTILQRKENVEFSCPDNNSYEVLLAQKAVIYCGIRSTEYECWHHFNFAVLWKIVAAHAYQFSVVEVIFKWIVDQLKHRSWTTDI